MDLINKIVKIIKENIDEKALFDINYDDKNNVIGYIASEKFNINEISEPDDAIWNLITSKLTSSELFKVLALFPESISDRLKRLGEPDDIDFKTQKYWKHISPDSSIYYVLIDTIKEDDNYKAYYLIINSYYNFSKGMIFNYTKEVIDYMSVHQKDLYFELLSNAFDNAKTSIRMHLMELYEKEKEKKKWGLDNKYNYVYEKFIMEPFIVNRVLFSVKEREMLKNKLKDIFPCETKTSILNNIVISEKIEKKEI